MIYITSEASNTTSRGSRNFSTYTLLGIVVAVGIVLSLVSYFYFVSVSNEIGDTIRNGLRQHSKNEAFHLCEILEREIQFIVSSVDIAVNSPSIQSGKVEQGSEVINLAQQRTSSLTDRFFWLDASGKTIWSSAFMNNPEEYEQYRGFDVSDKPYFVEVARTNKPYFGPVIKSPIDNSQRMFISYPVFVDGSFLGVVGASIKADQLAKSITEESSLGFESSVEIVDSQGNIVYSQAPEHIGENLFGEKLQSVLQAPAFESQEKLEEFNEFLRMSIDPTIPKEVHSIDFRTVTGDTATIIASPIRVVQSELEGNAEQHQELEGNAEQHQELEGNAEQHQELEGNAEQHQILTLYMSIPYDVAANVASLVDAQRNYSVVVIAAISAAAIIVSYFILSSNKRLERTVAERTQGLREANERLKEHDRLQSEFINVAAHELRTPVQSLLGAAEMLEDQMLAGEESIRMSKLVEMILRNAKRLAKLAYDILQVSRIESNSLKLQKEQINLQEKIERVIEDVKPFVDQGKQLQIVFEPKVNEPVIVEADRTKLFEVISNLLRNAIKFTSKGTIKIVLEKSDSEAIVTVQDTGKGIDPEIMPKMFEKFTSKSDSGNGLGLFISKSIVEAHGGTISGENNSNGIGAKFRFTLPLYIVKGGTEKEPPKA
jgi:signal transduction histidine kinase